ncbi:uncharacterized protein EKO05_0005813 [Ascochyta rabiei]|uniref:Uncharacterized protein n=1 Tax=Didymella rabiei TaxID=5454 RepID=A0A163LLI7_DIDRA|nr:uncharacterized protein EKO05_0005813 [Ascochyta rabiei]KZM27899.1 hypothetical protein ST47_g953 [Ascochyta rabiei]UPX15366.1 hypothetical protein EKO05_0005813 [Ascochyta rabiei]
MTAARSKVPAIGSAQWILEERHQSNDLVSQELEDFGFSVRNELEWLNEHMTEIFAEDGQHNLDVFKTPGKLRGKTPHTTRKRTVAEPRQPLANLFAADLQQRTTPAEQSLREIVQRSTVKSKFLIAEDTENEAPVQSPTPPTPVARQLFSKTSSNGKDTAVDSFDHELSDERSPPPQPAPAQWASFETQDTAFSSQADDVFSPPRTQTTQATQSFRQSMRDEDEEEFGGKDVPEDSFVSANDAFGSKNASKEDLREQAELNDALLDEDFQEDLRTESRGTVVHHEIDIAENDDEGEVEDMQNISDFPRSPRVISDSYSIGAETQQAFDTANRRAHAPEPKVLFDPTEIGYSNTPFGPPPISPKPIEHDNTMVHHDVDDEMEVDDEPTPSEKSSPVKPLVRKSSLTFACLPAREPILSKKSMGRTSQIRHTGGKSLGGSQIVQPVESQHDVSIDMEEDRPILQREGSETTKTHNKTSTQRLFERFQMLEQHAPPKRISQNIFSQSSRPSAYPTTASQPKEVIPPAQTSQSQPTYPTLPAAELETDEPEAEDDDDSWIAAPARPVVSAANPVRPPINKSHNVATHSSPYKLKPSPIKLVSTSNHDFSAAADSTTPVGSPAGKKYMDAPLSASKAKFYSALRAAKDKLIGSTTASAQVKLDALSSSPMRQKLQAAPSSDDLSSSPKRLERPISIFSHMRSPSKDSIKSAKSTKSAKSAKSDKTAESSGSPTKEASRKTRSSTEREKAKERDTREKEMLQKQQSEDRLREMREKEQTKAAAYHKKATAAAIAKTPSQMSSQTSLKPAPPINTVPKAASRPDSIKVNSAPKEQGTDSADEMPPPPPPKSLLPTFPTTKVRPPKKLVKPSSKDALMKPQEPQKIFIKNQYARAPPPAARPAPVTTKSTGPSTLGKSTSSRPTAATLTRPGTAMANKVAPSTKSAPNTMKAPPPKMTRPQPQASTSFEKPKPQASQPRADLAAARVPTTLRTVQDANSIRVPPVNTAKPPKRALENDTETIQRPPKRPSQLKQNPITPGHPSQYAKGKIPGLDSARASSSKPIQPSLQYPNGDDIKLPEIMTDSEDEDSDNEFEQPSWVNTPNLREMLSTQQLMDPEAIFGPIAPLNMEQVFPNKERHKRFRERTSSAYWVHDQVTDEEKRKEREARERLVREGAWTYNPSPRPTPRAGPSH